MSSASQKTVETAQTTAQRSGDLRQELIETGLRILSEDGLEKLTLRRVAARAGVSHAAPAYHFNGLPELLGHICAVGFTELTGAMTDALEGAPDDAQARLVAICEGYVRFALSNPGLVRLMFSNRAGIVDEAPLKPAAAQAYHLLRDICAPFEPVGDASDSTETLIWSLVHGFAFLRIGGRFDNPYRVSSAPHVSDVIPRLTLRKP